jgi:heme-degrading monooxygenase HmoA
MGAPRPPRLVNSSVPIPPSCLHEGVEPGGNLMHMPVVKINAIEVPPNAGPELEKRFAHRAHAVDNQPGFLGFQLLRPVKGEDRYFVVTQWETEEAFQAWASGPAVEAHAGQRANPVATGASLLEFEVVLDVQRAGA